MKKKTPKRGREVIMQLNVVFSALLYIILPTFLRLLIPNPAFQDM